MTDIDTLPVLPTGGFGKQRRLYRLWPAMSCSKHRLPEGPGLAASLAADAFADAAEQEEDTSGVDYVHIRIQQRNGKKSLTTVQVMGLGTPLLLLGMLHAVC